MHDRDRRPARRWHLALLLVPFVWQVGLLPFVNDVKVEWIAIPFPMLWQMMGIVVATIAIGSVFVIDRRRGDVDSPDDDGDEAQP